MKMPSFKNAFSLLQKIGKCMMLPVSVLPVAGILLGVGSANFSWLPPIVSQIDGGSRADAIFANLPLLFAIGVAIGLTENDGVAALAGTVGYVVFLAAMGVCAKLRGIETTTIMGIQSIETGVFGGIIVGSSPRRLFNRFYRIQLPPLSWLLRRQTLRADHHRLCGHRCSARCSASSGRRSATRINAFSNWAVHGQPALAFTIYGVVERALIPFGLHHVWNVPFFFQAGDYTDPATGNVVHGEIARFIAGDPTAGNMTGGYLFKMWGLPAAAIRDLARARPENRAKVGGIMVSAALTAFLTGITEPIEFAFLFVAPRALRIHALLAGAAYFLCIALGIKHGFTFSHGLIDYVVLFPKSHNALWLFVIGPIWARYLLRRFLVRDSQIQSDDAGPRSSGGKRSQPARGSERSVRAAAGPRFRRSLEHCEPRCLHHASARQAGGCREGQC